MVRRLNKENYTGILNLTHNNLSARIAGLLDCEERHGLQIYTDGQVQIGASWFRYLNDYSLSGGLHQFHFVDVLTQALDIPVSSEVSPLKSPRVSSNPKRTIAFQPWSSEAQKDWTDSAWVQLAKLLNRYCPEHSLQVLYHPTNQRRANALQALADENHIQLEMVALPLEDLAVELQSRCDLLVSVDTGIKHFAALLGVKVLELSLGSTDPNKTGAYQAGAIIIRAHREQLEAEGVAAVAFEQIRGELRNLAAIASEFNDAFKLFRVLKLKEIGFFALPLNSEQLKDSMHRCLEMMALHQVLQRNKSGQIQPYGTASLQLREIWQQIPERLMEIDLSSFLKEAEVRALKFEDAIGSVRKKLTAELQSQTDAMVQRFHFSSELHRCVTDLEKQMNLGVFLSQFMAAPISFYGVRGLLSALDDLAGVQKSIWKIIRNFEQNKTLEL